MRTHDRRTMVCAVLVAALVGTASTAPARAEARGVPLDARVEVGLTLTPVDSAAADATTYLISHGFTITARSRWLVTGAGTADDAQRAFGTRLLREHGTMRPAAPVGVPAALRAQVTGVVGLDTSRRWRPRVVPGLSAAQLRSAYDVRPPMSSAEGITVATAQFSGWVRSDLETYAAAAGVPLPTVTEKSIGGADPDKPDLDSGDIEVALDHQALLATAPGADHVIYFGNNSDLGTVQVYDAIAAAAERDEFDVLSISWGFCEFETQRSVLHAVNDAFARIVAAGKTIFAASGDLGARGCTVERFAKQPAVDFPASSPHVVAVGGTRITEAADGSWSEIGWRGAASDGTPTASGGGFSRVFSQPSWQRGIGAGTTARMVPDIAAVADPISGFTMFARSAGGWIAGAGTSLAAPVTAGHFAAALASLGKRDGLGRALHPILYANASAFRDVVSGSNGGYVAGPGYDRVTGLGSPQWSRLLPLLATGPIVSVPRTTNSLDVPVEMTAPAARTFLRYRLCENSKAARCDTPTIAADSAGPRVVRLAAGPSRVTRIVVVGIDAAGREFPGAAYTTYDADAPAVSASGRVTSPRGRTARFSWGAVDPAPGTGIARYDVRVVREGVRQPLRDYSGLGTSWTGLLSPGGAYTLLVRAVDMVGNTSGWTRKRLDVPYDETQLRLAGRWRSQRSPRAYLGSTASSDVAGATATVTARGRSADLIVEMGPAGGLADVLVDGKLARRVDTYSPTPVAHRAIRVAAWGGTASRVITVRVAGARRRASIGTSVVIDGLRINSN